MNECITLYNQNFSGSRKSWGFGFRRVFPLILGIFFVYFKDFRTRMDSFGGFESERSQDAPMGGCAAIGASVE